MQSVPFSVAEAKKDFAGGLIKGFALHHVESSMLPGSQVDVWMIELVFPTSTTAKGFLVDARSRMAREYRTLDAAVNTLRDIGFEVKALYSMGAKNG